MRDKAGDREGRSGANEGRSGGKKDKIVYIHKAPVCQKFYTLRISGTICLEPPHIC